MRHSSAVCYSCAATACSDADPLAPPDPAAAPGPPADPASQVLRVAAFGAKPSIQCILRVRRPGGGYRSKTLRIPVGGGQAIVRGKFIYEARIAGESDPLRTADCSFPFTAEAKNRLIELFGPRHRGTGVATAAQPPGTLTTSDICANLALGDPFTLHQNGTVLTMSVSITPCGGGEECDPWLELDWECECDGAGVDPEDECDDWDDGGGGGDDDGGGGGGGGGSGDPPCDPSCVAPPGFPQSEYDRLNAEEKRLCWESVTQCLSVNSARGFAEDFARAEAIRDGYTGVLADNKYDALRHAYWNAVMTRVLGAVRAEVWATAHESDEDPSDGSVCMDLANNEAGRGVGQSMPYSTYPEMQQVLRNMANASPPQLQLSPGC